MYTDCTNARVNGKSDYVFICATPDGKAFHAAREKKGHEGLKGTPVKYYDGVLVHNHEATFLHYGSGHQECLAHILWCLKGSMENEPDRKLDSIYMHCCRKRSITGMDRRPAQDVTQPGSWNMKQGTARYCRTLRRNTKTSRVVSIIKKGSTYLYAWTNIWQNIYYSSRIPGSRHPITQLKDC